MKFNYINNIALFFKVLMLSSTRFRILLISRKNYVQLWMNDVKVHVITMQPLLGARMGFICNEGSRRVWCNTGHSIIKYDCKYKDFKNGIWVSPVCRDMCVKGRKQTKFLKSCDENQETYSFKIEIWDEYCTHKPYQQQTRTKKQSYLFLPKSFISDLNAALRKKLCLGHKTGIYK